MGPRTLGEGFSHKMIVLLLNTPALVAQGRFRRRFRRFRNAVIAESRRGGGIKIASDAAGIERDNIIGEDQRTICGGRDNRASAAEEASGTSVADMLQTNV